MESAKRIYWLLSGARCPVITRAPAGRYCDYCKAQWGRVKDDWHPKAKTQAIVVCISETHQGKNNERAYCEAHRAEISTMADGSVWPLNEQMEVGRKLINGRAAEKAYAEAVKAAERV